MSVGQFVSHHFPSLRFGRYRRAPLEGIRQYSIVLFLVLHVLGRARKFILLLVKKFGSWVSLVKLAAAFQVHSCISWFWRNEKSKEEVKLSSFVTKATTVPFFSFFFLGFYRFFLPFSLVQKRMVGLDWLL